VKKDASMSHKIFLSHNHNDKPLVESVALKLASIFGQHEVFYDSWSIRPGDGIIDQMNKGLEAPEFVFFFVSANSLASGMVKLEWQNALYSASKGKTRIVPVRIDGSEMPAVLKQTLFIDMHTVGLEAAIVQIVGVTQGNASFTPQYQGFSNLTHTQTMRDDGSVEVTIKASHLMEPNTMFAFITKNEQSEMSFEYLGTGGFGGGFQPKVATDRTGAVANAVAIRPMNLVLRPGLPLRALFKKMGAKPVLIEEVLHQKSEDEWVPVPRSLA
jgi:hypothetical protein